VLDTTRNLTITASQAGNLQLNIANIKNPDEINISSQIISFDEKKFHQIMELDDIHPSSIIDSLNIESNINNMFKAGEGAGASGSFFFFSKDNKYLIKTLSETEKDIKLNMLDDFIAHLKQCDNKSLIARIYGIYSIKTSVYDTVYVMLM
jgi:1-phosphatidylinositol-4-phosphate 5-kinase